MPPKVSVVLPYQNAQATLDRAISSLVRQSFTDWELILVNHASTDESQAIARRWDQQDRRIRLVHEPRAGLVHALNTGLNRSTASVIARMDADDVSHRDRLARQYDYLARFPATDVVSCCVRYCAEGTPQRGMQTYVDWTNGLLTKDEIHRNRFVESPLVHPSVMFRTHLIRQHGSYRQGLFPEDYELWLRWLHHQVSISKLPETLLDWYDSEARLSRTHERYRPEAFYRIKTHYLARWLAQHNPFHPEVVVWGGGRKSRQRMRLLENYGIRVRAVIDIVANKTTSFPIIFYQDVAPPGQYFILSYVGNRGQRDKIRSFLRDRGYSEEDHFLLVA